jgi:hypothetical protein
MHVHFEICFSNWVKNDLTFELSSLEKLLEFRIFVNIQAKQAGAELCQAHKKLGLAKLALPLNVVIFHLKNKNYGCLPFAKNGDRLLVANKMRLSSICLQIEVFFHLL